MNGGLRLLYNFVDAEEPLYLRRQGSGKQYYNSTH